MQAYVAGFAFNEDLTHVVMVSKLKPEWQRGKLNAVGGKIENAEMAHIAMVREFQEETSVHVPVTRWTSLTTITDIDKFIVHFYYTQLSSEAWKSIQTVEEEEIIKVSLEDMKFHKRIDNIDMLITMAQYKIKTGYIFL